MAHILTVDDDPLVLTSISKLLKDAGHTVSKATGGHEALDSISHQRPDLIIVDIIMPRMSGLEVCRRLRADPFLFRMPILFLSAKGRPTDIAHGLEVGADDYVVKPFQPVELLARVHALLRRAPGGPLDQSAEYLTAGDLRLHTRRPEIQVGERLIQLTVVEHRLMHYLMLYAGQPLSTDRLLEDVWEQPSGAGNPKLVQVHIANLRAKIERQPDSPVYIRTVRGRGYVVGE